MDKKTAEIAQSTLRSIIKDNLNDIYPKLWNRLQNWEIDPALGPDLNTCRFIEGTPYFDEIIEADTYNILTKSKNTRTFSSTKTTKIFDVSKNAFDEIERLKESSKSLIRTKSIHGNINEISGEIKSDEGQRYISKCMAFTDLITLYFHFRQSYIFYDDFINRPDLLEFSKYDGKLMKKGGNKFVDECIIDEKFSMDEYMANLDYEYISNIIPEQRKFSTFNNSYMSFFTFPGFVNRLCAIEFKNDRIIYICVDITSNGWIYYVDTIVRPYDVDMVFYFRNNHYVPAGKCSQCIFPVKEEDKNNIFSKEVEYTKDIDDHYDYIDNLSDQQKCGKYYGLDRLSDIFGIHKLLYEYINREVHVKRSLGVIDRLPPETRKNIEDQHISILDFDYTIYESEGDREWQGGHHASPTMHERREHKRHYKNGKVVDVRKTTVASWNPPSQYKTKGEKDEE